MPRMIELMRDALVPPNIMQTASKGALALPGPEMVEILVYLATENTALGEQAGLTLATWDASSLSSLLRDRQTPHQILEYFISAKNVRQPLLPALLENLSLADEKIAQFAAVAPREAVDLMISSARVYQSKPILTALNTNPNLSGVQSETITGKLRPPKNETDEILLAVSSSSVEGDDVLDEEIVAYLKEHAAEIEHEGDKVFHPIGGRYDDILDTSDPLEDAVSVGGGAAAKRAKKPSDELRGGALQKISKLNVKGRIQLAMKGTKEERSILVRDGTKVVAVAVLESPKITDAEVEMYASQKNVLEAVLRYIPLKRRFAKHYGIVRNLVFNPRTPLDVSLGLIKNLLINDLKNLSGNKEVSETVKKLGLKMYKQKKDAGRK